MPIHLRAFAKTPDLQSAEAIEGKFISILQEFDPMVVEAPKRYWKLDGHFEFTYALSPNVSERMAFDSILQLAEGAWQVLGTEQEPEAVWNQASNSAFICPEITWAHLELLSSLPNPPLNSDPAASG